MRLRLAVVAALCALGLAGVIFAAACDDKTDVHQTVPEGSVTPRNPSTSGSPSTGGTQSDEQPFVKTPAGQWGVLAQEVPSTRGTYKVDGFNSFDYDATSFSSQSGLFKSPEDGDRLSQEWKIADGSHVVYIPDGQLAGLISGAYYVTIDVYIFATNDGAKAMFTYADNLFGAIPGSERQQVKGLGNQWGAYQLKGDPIGPNDAPSVYHRFMVRRGNLVAIVQTLGVQQYMTVDRARDIAVIIDDKALGKRAVTVPTPIPTPAVPPTAAAPTKTN